MVALVLTLLLATVAGLVLRRRNGRFRTVPPRTDAPSPVTGASPRVTTALAVPGARATFVQLSAEHCAVCPSVARILGEVAAGTPGVAHVELRAEENLDLVRRYDVRRSPTVLLVDATGRVVSRASGAMTAPLARAALAALPAHPHATDHSGEPIDANA